MTARPTCSSLSRLRRPERASLLIIVIWIAFALVSITIYFAHSMSFEMRAADNRAAALESEEAIEGAARYVGCLLSNLDIPGSMPDQQTYLFQNVAVGNAHFWLIGQGMNDTDPQTMAHFGLRDESAKLNLNYCSSNILANLASVYNLQDLTPEVISSILAWRNTNSSLQNGGAETSTYMALQPPYLCKNSKFETVDELRLVYEMTTPMMFGEDGNLNNFLDPNENDGDTLPPSDNRDGELNPGLLDLMTVYSREPTVTTNGMTRFNITTFSAISQTSQRALTQALTNGTSITLSRARQIVSAVSSRVRPMGSPLEFYVRAGLSLTEIAQVEPNLRGTNVAGLLNVNTASTALLSCIPGLDTGQASTLTQYRQNNTNVLNGSIGWITQVLPATNAYLAGPYLTGKTYQYAADIAAVGHNGRGYRRTLFIFDTSQYIPVILYRRDLTHLGWALGKEGRNPTLAGK